MLEIMYTENGDPVEPIGVLPNGLYFAYPVFIKNGNMFSVRNIGKTFERLYLKPPKKINKHEEKP